MKQFYIYLFILQSDILAFVSYSLGMTRCESHDWGHFGFFSQNLTQPNGRDVQQNRQLSLESEMQIETKAAVMKLQCGLKHPDTPGIHRSTQSDQPETLHMLRCLYKCSKTLIRFSLAPWSKREPICLVFKFIIYILPYHRQYGRFKVVYN